MAKRAKSVPRKRNIPKIIAIIFAVLLVIAFILMGFDYGILNENSILVPVDRTDGKINVLLLGVDVEGLRTDAIMVASYNIKENKLNMLSIPRDTRMYIGNRYQKINAAHAIGGMTGKIAGPEGTVEAVTRLTGIPINYYIEFSFSAIDHFSEALGPVTFNVPDVEGGGRGMNYEDPYQDLYIHLKPGEQELVGNEVQQLLRYRKSMYKDKNGNLLGYADGDRGRTQMQHDFIKAVVDQKLNARLIFKLPDIFESLSNDIKTNLSISDITKYAKYLQGFSSENISSYQLPGESKTIGGGSYWVCDLEATKTLIQDVFGYDASDITIDSHDGKKASSNTSSKAKSTPTPEPVEEDTDEEETSASPSPTPSAAPKATAQPDDTDADSDEDDRDTDSVDDDDNNTSDKPAKTTAPTQKPAKTAAPAEPDPTEAPAEPEPTKKPARPTANPEAASSEVINLD